MNYTYQYKGTISVSSERGRSCILEDMCDYGKPPVAVTVPCREMADYLEARGWTDDEERYLTQTWIYDRNLFLQAVIIPSTHEYIPAKVIACENPDMMSDGMIIFGPSALITTDRPEPMDYEEYLKWLDFRTNFGLRPRN